MSHSYTSHVTHTNASCHTHTLRLLRRLLRLLHDSYAEPQPSTHGVCYAYDGKKLNTNKIILPKLFCAEALGWSESWRDSLMCVTWRICVCDMARVWVWHDSLFMGVVSRIHVSHVTRLWVWHDSFMRVTQRIYGCGVTHLCMRLLCVWHHAFMYLTWLIYEWDVTHTKISHS